VREIINPALGQGMCVIADRFFDSTTAYQGAARKLDRETVERLNVFGGRRLHSGRYFCSRYRCNQREVAMQEPRRQDRMEQEPDEFYERVRQAYRDLAIRESNRVVLISGARNADEIENEIWKMLCSRFPNLNTGHLTLVDETAKRRDGDRATSAIRRFSNSF